MEFLAEERRLAQVVLDPLAELLTEDNPQRIRRGGRPSCDEPGINLAQGIHSLLPLQGPLCIGGVLAAEPIDLLLHQTGLLPLIESAGNASDSTSEAHESPEQDYRCRMFHRAYSSLDMAKSASALQEESYVPPLQNSTGAQTCIAHREARTYGAGAT